MSLFSVYLNLIFTLKTEAAPSIEVSVSTYSTRCLNTKNCDLKGIVVNYELGRMLEEEVVAKYEALSEKYVCTEETHHNPRVGYPV